MTMHAHLSVWLKESIELLDVRYIRFDRWPHAAPPYRLPASAFLFVEEGDGRVLLNGISYDVGRSGVLHGGKGSTLHVLPGGQMLVYYIIFYKAVRTPDQHAFEIEYAWKPAAALPLHTIVDELFRQWQLANAAGKLQAKGLLYQFAGELMNQALLAADRAEAPDILSQATDWIQRRYFEELNVELLAQRLHCSASYLTRLFRRKLSMSTMEYVTSVRIGRAKQLLRDTGWSLREIALQVGYRDEYYFSRVFKKNTGRAPIAYRRDEAGAAVQKSPSNRSDRSIVPLTDNRYPFVDNDYHTRKQDGEMFMERWAKPSALATILLGASLIISACSGTNAVNNTNALSGQPANVEGTGGSGTSQAAASVREVQHTMGSTSIPVDPKRIVVDGLEDIALALEIPIAYASVPTGHYLYNMLESNNVSIIEMMEDQMNYEAIMAGDPDLIIASDLTVYEQEIYDNLNKIAPTIVFERGDWKKSIAELAAALDISDKAEAVIEQYESKLQQSRDAIAQAGAEGRTVAAMRTSTKEVQVFYPWFAYTQLLYNELGLNVAPRIAQLMEGKEEGTWGEIASLELLPELSADYLFVTVGSSYAAEEEFAEALRAMQDVEELEVWKQNEAVKNNNVYIISARHWMLNGPIADAMKIDDVLAAVVGKQR